MPRKKCCVPQCKSTQLNNSLHTFPNPERYPERYRLWTNAIGGEFISMDPKRVFKLYKICHSHFERRFHTHNFLLTTNAIPTLDVPGYLNSVRLDSMNPTSSTNNATSHAPSIPSPASLTSNIDSLNPLAHPVFEMPSNNAEKCKNYRKRKKEAALKIKTTPKTAAERSRMYRLRRKQLAQGSKLSANEVLYTPMLNSQMTFEPSPQPVTTEKPFITNDIKKEISTHNVEYNTNHDNAANQAESVYIKCEPPEEFEEKSSINNDIKFELEIDTHNVEYNINDDNGTNEAESVVIKCEPPEEEFEATIEDKIHTQNVEYNTNHDIGTNEAESVVIKCEPSDDKFEEKSLINNDNKIEIDIDTNNVEYNINDDNQTHEVESVFIKCEPEDGSEGQSAGSSETQSTNSNQSLDNKAVGRNAERNRLYRERHREEINQRRRENRNRKKKPQTHPPNKEDINKIEQNTHTTTNSRTQRQQRYYERHKEEINKRKREGRLQNSVQSIPASAAERNRIYRERNKQKINERRKYTRRLQRYSQQVKEESAQQDI